MRTSAPFLTGAPTDCSFALTDHHGRDVTDADYRGRFLLVYFGFTHCRVVCPRALARLSETLSLLDDLAERIQPLYVTVDPARDTPATMKAYLEPLYPGFIGLTGTREQTDAAKRTFRVFAERAADPDDPSGYAVPHSALSYLVGPDGRYVAHFPDMIGRDELARRLREHIAIRKVPGSRT
jgi:protein SCO1/2